VPKYVIDYKAAPVKASPAFPDRSYTLRPYIALSLSHGSSRVQVYALADTGADSCLFPAYLAERLRLNLTEGKPYTFVGLGSPEQQAFFFDLAIDVIGFARYVGPVGFTEALRPSGIGLLGQNGFFDRFDVTFRHRSAQLELFLD
jgi:hypothetical protein